MDNPFDIPPYVRAKPLHLEIRDDTPLSVFKELLSTLKDDKYKGGGHKATSGQRWYLGDVRNFARSKAFYEEEGFSMLHLCIEVGYTLKTVEQSGEVAARYPPGERREDLSFTHHRLAAPLSPTERHKALREAAKKGLKSDDFRLLLKRRKEFQTQRKEPEGNGLKDVVAICPLCEGSGVVHRQRV